MAPGQAGRRLSADPGQRSGDAGRWQGYGQYVGKTPPIRPVATPASYQPYRTGTNATEGDRLWWEAVAVSQAKGLTGSSQPGRLFVHSLEEENNHECAGYSIV